MVLFLLKDAWATPPCHSCAGTRRCPDWRWHHPRKPNRGLVKNVLVAVDVVRVEIAQVVILFVIDVVCVVFAVLAENVRWFDVVYSVARRTNDI